MHQCALCPYSVKCSRDFKRHLVVHSDEKPFKCPECPFRAKQERNIKSHVKNVHLLKSASPSSFPFPCPHPGCNYAAKEKSNLTRHSNLHSEKSFSCSHPNCGFSTRHKESLNSHTRRIHLGEKPWVCPFESCSFAAGSSSDLVVHTRTHTKEKPYKCSEPNCEYSAADNSLFKRHQLIHQAECPSFKCPLCEHSTNDKSNLSHHIKRHTLEKNFICSVESCEYRSHTKHDLDSHMKSHSDERQFKCELCPFRGKLRQTVRSHLKHVHSDLRPFKCTESECDFAAKDTSNLKKHLLTHNGDKKYTCSFPDCVYAAVHKFSVKSHEMFVHSDEKKEKCTICDKKFKTKSQVSKHMRIHTKK